MEKLFSMISKMNKFPADLLFSIANEAISALNISAVNTDRHPFVSANLDCAMKDLRDAESDWNSTFHPFDMDEDG